MAEATSLTDSKIQELMAGWQAVSDRQDDLNAEITELKGQVETYQQLLTEFTEMTLPQVEALVAANSIETADLKDNLVPGVQAEVDQNSLELDNLSNVSVPALQADISSIGSNISTIGVPYRQPDEPLDDDPDHPIQVGTKWYDTDDGDKERFWDGTVWVESGGTVADFSLTAKKFKTSTHMIY